MLQDFLDWLAGTPQETTLTLADVKPGRVKIDGNLHCEAPIAAAIGKSRCAGYFYHSSYMVGSRVRGYLRRRLRDALVYAPGLKLELPDGSLKVVPRNAESWSPEHHLALVAEGYEGFEATEKVLREGAKVRIVGNVKRSGADGGLVLHFAELHLLEAERGSGKRNNPSLDSLMKKPATKKKVRKA